MLPAVVPVNHSRRTPTPHRTAPSSSQQGGSQTPSTQNPHTHHHHHGNANNQNGVKRPATACCGSPAAGPPPQNASVPLVFFTYPSWLQVEEVSEKQRERLLACRRYPFGNTNSGSGGGGGGGASAFTGRPPTAPTSPLSSRSVILLFQPKKELRPMMREPPHPPKELGEVCCCDVYLVLHGGVGAAASTVDDHSRDGELPEMSVWGLCDTSSHLHGASGNGTNGGAGRRPIRASSAHPHTPPLQKGHTEHESTSAVHDGVPTTTTSSTGGSPTNRQHRLSSMHSAYMADPHLEFFCIASSLDNYFRLGAAFGWVYGWQLCYCSVGPPVSSIPWLRLFNASAYQAAKALMSSYECVESTSCLAATSRIGMMVDDEEDDVDIVCH